MEELFRNQEGQLCTRVDSQWGDSVERALLPEMEARAKAEFDSHMSKLTDIDNQQISIQEQITQLEVSNLGLQEQRTHLETKLTPFGAVFLEPEAIEEGEEVVVAEESTEGVVEEAATELVEGPKDEDPEEPIVV